MKDKLLVISLSLVILFTSLAILDNTASADETKALSITECDYSDGELKFSISVPENNMAVYFYVYDDNGDPIFGPGSDITKGLSLDVSLKIELADGQYELLVYNSKNPSIEDKRTFRIYGGTMSILSFSVSYLEMTTGSSKIIPLYIKGVEYDDIELLFSSKDILSGVLQPDGKIALRSKDTAGTVKVSIRVKGDIYINDTLEVTVKETGSDILEEYNFFVKMLIQYDSVESSFSKEELKEGFLMTGYGSNASEALKDACARYGIPLELYPDGDMAGSVNKMFGLGDEREGDSQHTYWAQFYNGVIDQTPLENYTDGGNFEIIRMTSAYDASVEYPEGIELNYTERTMQIGDILYLRSTVSPSDALVTDVLWSSSNPSVATVDDNGKVTAFKKGTTMITVTTCIGNVTAMCVVTVDADTVIIPINADIDNSGDGTIANVTEDQMKDALEEAKAVDQEKVPVIEIDATSETPSDRTVVVIPSQSLRELADIGGEMIITTSSGTIILDNEAVIMLSEDGDEIDIIIERIDNDDLYDDLREIVGDNIVFDIIAMVDGRIITKLNAWAIVMIPFDADGQDASKLTVWHIDDDGELTEHITRYDPDENAVVFLTDHFSYFMVAYPDEPASINDDGNPVILYVVLIIIAVAITMLSLFFYRRSMKDT